MGIKVNLEGVDLEMYNLLKGKDSSIVLSALGVASLEEDYRLFGGDSEATIRVKENGEVSVDLGNVSRTLVVEYNMGELSFYGVKEFVGGEERAIDELMSFDDIFDPDARYD